MSHNEKWIIGFVCLGLAVAGSIFGQASAINGEITGTVMDASGATVAGAPVQLSNVETGLKLNSKTADSGLYRFTLLPLGTYVVEVRMPGFATATYKGIAVSAGATATVEER